MKLESFSLSQGAVLEAINEILCDIVAYSLVVFYKIKSYFIFMFSLPRAVPDISWSQEMLVEWVTG